MCACVREKEREREADFRKLWMEKNDGNGLSILSVCLLPTSSGPAMLNVGVYVYVNVCVCVCV